MFSELIKIEEFSLIGISVMGDVESFEDEDESEMESFSIMVYFLILFCLKCVNFL